MRSESLPPVIASPPRTWLEGLGGTTSTRVPPLTSSSTSIIQSTAIFNPLPIESLRVIARGRDA